MILGNNLILYLQLSITKTHFCLSNGYIRSCIWQATVRVILQPHFLGLIVKIEQSKVVIEQFSNDCRKTKTKAITPTNHDRNKQHYQ